MYNKLLFKTSFPDGLLNMFAEGIFSLKIGFHGNLSQKRACFRGFSRRLTQIHGKVKNYTILIH